MTKIRTPQNLEKRIIETSTKVGKFSPDITLPIPFLPELLVRGYVKAKGFLLGADYAVISTEGGSSDDCQYSLSGAFYKK